MRRRGGERKLSLIRVVWYNDNVYVSERVLAKLSGSYLSSTCNRRSPTGRFKKGVYRQAEVHKPFSPCEFIVPPCFQLPSHSSLNIQLSYAEISHHSYNVSHYSSGVFENSYSCAATLLPGYIFLNLLSFSKSSIPTFYYSKNVTAISNNIAGQITNQIRTCCGYVVNRCKVLRQATGSSPANGTAHSNHSLSRPDAHSSYPLWC